MHDSTDEMTLIERSTPPLPAPRPDFLAAWWRDPVLALLIALFALAIAWHAFGFAHIDFDAPLVYMGDALYYQYLYSAMFEGGWFGTIERAGAPLGATQFDFPNVDGLNLLLMRIGELFGGGPFVAFNTFVLLTFPLCAAIAYLVHRRLGLGRPWALVGALAFTMLPFHFQRLGHVFFLAYFVAAIAFWLAFDFVGGHRRSGAGRPRTGMVVAAAVACGTCGIYYAFFSCLFVLAVAMHSSAVEGALAPLRRGVLVCLIVVSASTLNLAPTLWHVLTEGRNTSVATRTAQESEIYGLKFAQLVLPRDGHRIPALASLRSTYEASAPLSNENRTATLGMFGALGFLILLLIPFMGRLGRDIPVIARIASAPAYAGLLYATIGGVGALFAFLVWPQLRGLNRISPFLGFLGILCSAALLDHFARNCAVRWSRAITWIAAPVLAACVLFDQVPAGGPFWKPIHAELMRQFNRDRTYYREVEQQLGKNAMVMQLPMLRYPEAPRVKQMASYDSLVAMLHTESTHWTAGAMTGRSAEHWQRLFEAFPLQERISTLVALGFTGVDLDVRGLGDERPAMISEFDQHGFRRIAASSDEQNIMLAVPTPRAPEHRALAIAPANGWTTMESANGAVWWWTAGEATLDVGNVSGGLRSCRLELILESFLVPRTVSLWEGGRKIAEQHLQPSVPTPLNAKVDGDRTMHRLTLRTDAPAHSIEGDPRKLAYRLIANAIPLCE